MLYVALDVFSRFVVGWLLADRENSTTPQHFLRETMRKQGIAPGMLTVHQDRGSRRPNGVCQRFASEALASSDQGSTFAAADQQVVEHLRFVCPALAIVDLVDLQARIEGVQAVTATGRDIQTETG